MKMVLLGTGTSHGIPCIACDCDVCRSKDRRDKRLRCSAYVTNKNKDGTVSSILVDIGPEFRIQALRRKIKAVDCLLLTHSHADHVHGLDDIRIFSHTASCANKINCARGKETPGQGLPVYGNRSTLRDLKNRFDYIFKETQIGGGKPKLVLKVASDLMERKEPKTGDVAVTPIPMMHGNQKSCGYVFTVTDKKEQKHSIAYLTDCSMIKETGFERIAAIGGTIDHVVIDGLREEPHQTHFSYLQAMEAANRIGGKHTWLTHMCHSMSHVQILEYIEKHLTEFPVLEKIVMDGGSVEPAYDGLILKC